MGVPVYTGFFLNSMRLNLEFNNADKSPISRQIVEKIILETFRKGGLKKIKNYQVSLSMAVIPEKEIKRFNRIYRKKNRITDVLAFPEFKNSLQLEKSLDVEKDVFLGEVLLCYNDIKKYCQKNNRNIKKELAEVIAHGVLHLLGYRHGQKMFEIQKEIARAV